MKWRNEVWPLNQNALHNTLSLLTWLDVVWLCFQWIIPNLTGLSKQVLYKVGYVFWMDSESLLQFAVECRFLHMFIDTLVVYSANFFLMLLKFPSRLVCFITYLAEPYYLANLSWFCGVAPRMRMKNSVQTNTNNINIYTLCVWVCECVSRGAACMTNACRWSAELMCWAQVIWFDKHS